MVSSEPVAVFVFIEGAPPQKSKTATQNSKEYEERRRVLLVVEYCNTDEPDLSACRLKNHIVPHLSEQVMLCKGGETTDPKRTGDKTTYLTHNQSVWEYGVAAPFGALEIPVTIDPHSAKALWVVQGRPRHYRGSRQPLVRFPSGAASTIDHLLAYVKDTWVTGSPLTVDEAGMLTNLFCALLSNAFPEKALELIGGDIDALDAEVFRELVQRMRHSRYNRLSTDFSLDDTHPSGLVWLPKTDSTLNLLHWAAVHNEPRLIPRKLLAHLSPFTIDRMYGNTTAEKKTAVTTTGQTGQTQSRDDDHVSTRVKTFHSNMYTRSDNFDPLQYAAQFNAIVVMQMLIGWMQMDNATLTVLNRTTERTSCLKFYPKEDPPAETRAPSALTLATVSNNFKCAEFLVDNCARFDTRCLTFRTADDKFQRKYAIHDGYDALLARMCAVASYIRARELHERIASNADRAARRKALTVIGGVPTRLPLDWRDC
jgi:hypothetical protein